MAPDFYSDRADSSLRSKWEYRHPIQKFSWTSQKTPKSIEACSDKLRVGDSWIFNSRIILSASTWFQLSFRCSLSTLLGHRSLVNSQTTDIQAIRYLPTNDFTFTSCDTSWNCFSCRFYQILVSKVECAFQLAPIYLFASSISMRHKRQYSFFPDRCTP